MKVTADLISTAMIKLLRDRHPPRGGCIGLDTLREAWNTTGLRASDLDQCLRQAAAAGIIRLHDDSFGGRLELTERGAQVLYAPIDPGNDQDWNDDVALHRIRQRGLVGSASSHRRDSD